VLETVAAMCATAAARQNFHAEDQKKTRSVKWRCGYTVPTMIVVCLVKNVKTSRKKRAAARRPFSGGGFELAPLESPLENRIEHTA
jgi:hypothetical protein